MKQVIIAMPQMGNDLFRRYMKSKYVSSLKRAGASVRWIEPEKNPDYIHQAVSCDGLLLPGGADVSPELYHQARSEKTGKPNPIRDQAEPELLRAFLSSGKPVLGICRGIQIMNVFFGGNLLQDIKETQKYKHMDFFSRSGSSHPVSITEGTQLYRIVGQNSVCVNSMHHQAIDHVGKDLIVSAVSSDGFIEAVELENYKFCMGVQWHPEHMSAGSKQQQALFDAFVGACQ